MALLDPITFFTYISIFTSILLFLGYILLFGDQSCHSSGPIAWLHDFLVFRLPAFIRNRLCIMCFSSTSVDNLSTSAGRFFEKFVMPAAYVLLLVGGLAMTKFNLINRLQELEVIDQDLSPCPRSRFYCHQPTLISFPLRTPPTAIYVYAVVSFTTWLAVLLTDPGSVTSSSFLSVAGLFPYDNALFVRGKICRTCELPKLPRSKHCSLCNRCVVRFDHHCGWVGTCVGFYNLRYFLLFLAVHAVMLLHGIMLCVEIVRARMLDLIAGHFIYRPTETPITEFSFKMAFIAETNVCAMLFVFQLSFLLVTGFFLYHVSLVWRNNTTNESAKWDGVYRHARAFEEQTGMTLGVAMKEEALAEKENGGPHADALLDQLPVFDEKGIPRNIYKQGQLRNWFQVLFPGTYRSRLTLSEQEKKSWQEALGSCKHD